MSSKSILFLDLDGPILDVRARYFQVHAATRKEMALSLVLTVDEYWSRKRNGVSEKQLLEEEGVESNIAAVFSARWTSNIERREWLLLDVLQPGIITTLQDLRHDNTLILVTLRRDRNALMEQLCRIEIDSYFVEVLSAPPDASRGAEVKASLMKSFVSPDVLSWIVCDTETDVRAGKLLGMRTIAVTNGIRTEEKLRAVSPDLVIPSLLSSCFSDFQDHAETT